jgi:hypothetical protein
MAMELHGEEAGIASADAGAERSVLVTQDFNEDFGVDEDQPPAKASSWSAALSQLPGFLADHAVAIPHLAGKARAITRESDEDLAGDDEPAAS